LHWCVQFLNCFLNELKVFRFQGFIGSYASGNINTTMEESGPSNDFDIESYFLDGLVSLEMGSKKEKITSKLDRKTELNQKEGGTLQSRTQTLDLLSGQNNDIDKQADKVTVSHVLEH